MIKYSIGQLLVSAFPGTGKSHYVNYGEGSGYMPQGFATDSDSSKFDKSAFPANYITHIKKCMDEGYARIFISSHKEVRNALVENNLPFTLVYPEMGLKDEYIERYKKRGNNIAFIEMMQNNWEKFIEDCQSQKGCKHIALPSMTFISNIM